MDWFKGKNKPESPMIFMTKFMVSGEDFPLNQSILVGGLEHFLFSILYGIILPIKVLARAPPRNEAC